MPGRWIRRILAAFILCTIALSVWAQPHEGYKNLKVLPKDISQADLRATMSGFTRALGVRCVYCHVGEEGKMKPEDWEKDDKATKRTAREMLRMVQDINATYLARLENRAQPTIVVKCATCHHGVSQPRALQDVLATSYETGGIDSTLSRYQALRNRYYGSAAYDFGEVPLVDVSNQLRQQGHPEDAMRLLALNVDLNPNSTYAKRRLSSATMSKAFMTAPDSGTVAYNDLKARYGANVINQDLVNEVGYQLLAAHDTGSAIAALKLNVAEHPESADAYDSLGEAYMANSDWKLATEAYKKSLTLDPTNENAKRQLDDIKVKSKQKKPKAGAPERH